MKKIFKFLILALSSFSLQAQQAGTNSLFMSWEMAIPTTTDFVGKTSFRGGRLDYRHFFTDQFSAGIALSWNSFEELFPTKTYYSRDGLTAVTTDMDRFVYTLPISLNGHYYFKSSIILKPYVGLNLGAQYSEQSTYFNVFVIQEKNWGFLFRPEAGVIVPFDEFMGAFAGVSYNIATNKNEAFRINNLQHLAINVGLVFLL